MPRVILFENGYKDPERAIAFYSAVFDWKFDAPRWDYWPVHTGPSEERGIHGGFGRSKSENQLGTRVVIEVPNIDEYIEKAVQNGAKVFMPKMTFNGFYLAYLEDPEGVGFGLLQPDPSAKHVE